MKILMYCLNYAPELTGIGKYTSEHAEWLVAQGHDVRVVTAPPYYPEWSVAAGYKAWQYRRECRNGVDIFRTPIWVPRSPSGLKRLLHLASFALSSLPALLVQAPWKPDVIFVVEPPLFCSPAALVFSKLFHAKSWLHIQDFEIDAAFSLGLLKNKRLQSMVLKAERWLMGKFGTVSTISKAMMELARRKGVNEDRLIHFPNWVDLNNVAPQSSSTAFRQSLGIPVDAIVGLYSGNMGGKQGLEVLGDAAHALRARTNIHFIFCGDGPAKAALQEQCASLERIHFLPLQPAALLPALLATADIHLLPQRADAADLVMPSKLTGMLASGRPIVATANDGTELAATVATCGLVVPPNEPQALADAVLVLAKRHDMRFDFGRQARRYAEHTLAIDSILGAFIERASKLLQKQRSYTQ